MNIFTATGNLGKDCRTNQVGQSSVCNFSIGVKSGYGDKASTIWVDCSLWGKQAEGSLPQYLLKGQQVAVSGELGTKEHNGKTYITLNVGSITLTGGKQQGYQQAPKQATSNTAQNGQRNSEPEIDLDDDIPF